MKSIAADSPPDGTSSGVLRRCANVKMGGVDAVAARASVIDGEAIRDRAVGEFVGVAVRVDLDVAAFLELAVAGWQTSLLPEPTLVRASDRDTLPEPLDWITFHRMDSSILGYTA